MISNFEKRWSSKKERIYENVYNNTLDLRIEECELESSYATSQIEMLRAEIEVKEYQEYLIQEERFAESYKCARDKLVSNNEQEINDFMQHRKKRRELYLSRSSGMQIRPIDPPPRARSITSSHSQRPPVVPSQMSKVIIKGSLIKNKKNRGKATDIPLPSLYRVHPIQKRPEMTTVSQMEVVSIESKEMKEQGIQNEYVNIIQSENKSCPSEHGEIVINNDFDHLSDKLSENNDDFIETPRVLSSSSNQTKSPGNDENLTTYEKFQYENEKNIIDERENSEVITSVFVKSSNNGQKQNSNPLFVQVSDVQSMEMKTQLNDSDEFERNASDDVSKHDPVNDNVKEIEPDIVQISDLKDSNTEIQDNVIARGVLYTAPESSSINIISNKDNFEDRPSHGFIEEDMNGILKITNNQNTVDENQNYILDLSNKNSEITINDFEILSNNQESPMMRNVFPESNENIILDQFDNSEKRTVKDLDSNEKIEISTPENSFIESQIPCINPSISSNNNSEEGIDSQTNEVEHSFNANDQNGVFNEGKGNTKSEDEQNGLIESNPNDFLDDRIYHDVIKVDENMNNDHNNPATLSIVENRVIPDDSVVSEVHSTTDANEGNSSTLITNSNDHHNESLLNQNVAGVGEIEDDTSHNNKDIIDESEKIVDSNDRNSETFETTKLNEHDDFDREMDANDFQQHLETNVSDNKLTENHDINTNFNELLKNDNEASESGHILSSMLADGGAKLFGSDDE